MSKYRIEVEKRGDGKGWWRVVTIANGNILLTSQTYSRYSTARREATSYMNNMSSDRGKVDFVDLTLPE